MKIAKIVKSNSHLDYVGRVIDALDVALPPKAEDYGFAQFVSLPIDEDQETVGVIYNSILVNPEYSNCVLHWIHFGRNIKCVFYSIEYLFSAL